MVATQRLEVQNEETHITFKDKVEILQENEGPESIEDN